jgi:hypothetical protein
MASFPALKWDDPDVWGVIVGRGVATVESGTMSRVEAWLDSSGYSLVEFNFGDGISPAVAELGRYFRWLEQFGYALDSRSRNLDALRDGFEIDSPNLVFKLSSFERAWSEDKAWAQGLLSVISEYSLRQLALGERFFALVPIPDSESILVGEPFEELGLPFPFRFRGKAA